jgi:lipopolysaccharide assembly outer membrane protein LptD (OstA)
VLEPRAGYALAIPESQNRHTLFVPPTAAPQDRLRALDLDAVTRDDADRIARANRVSAGFGNRFYRRGALLADVALLGLYDFTGHRLDALVADGRAFPHERVDVRFHADFDPSEVRLDEGLAQGTWSHPVGVRVDAGYRWARRVPLFFEDFALGERFEAGRDVDHIHQIQGGTTLDLTEQWSVGYRFAYSIEGNLLLANQGIVEYLSRCKCWALGLRLSQDRSRGIDASLEYRLVGFGGEPAERRRGLLDGFGGLW